MKVKDLSYILDTHIAPKSNQESYDNCGLIIGNPESEITGILTTLDVNEDVIKEAIEKKCNVIIAHHPIIFKGLKTLVSKTKNERTIISAVQNDISIYAAHTSLDNRFQDSINKMLADKIGLTNVLPLKTLKEDYGFFLGAGAIGTLAKPEFVVDFIFNLRRKLNMRGSINFSTVENNIQIDKIAICTGTASFMAEKAKQMGAQLLITADITYHTFFDEEGIILVDIGHYESEKHASEVIANLLKTYDVNVINPELVQVSKVNTNPILLAF